MESASHQFENVKRIIRWFIKEEVKTPLSFFFKVIPYITAAWIAILYAPGIDGQTKLTLVKFSALVFGGLCLLVALLAFFKPRHLVYGESGHRAERRMEFGTEKRTYTSEELELLEPTRNPQQLTGGEDPR